MSSRTVEKMTTFFCMSCGTTTKGVPDEYNLCASCGDPVHITRDHPQVKALLKFLKPCATMYSKEQTVDQYGKFLDKKVPEQEVVYCLFCQREVTVTHPGNCSVCGRAYLVYNHGVVADDLRQFLSMQPRRAEVTPEQAKELHLRFTSIAQHKLALSHEQSCVEGEQLQIKRIMDEINGEAK